jgi:hypothetical protein
LFWWTFGSSSNFGRILQNYKLNGLGLLQCSGRGGALPPGHSRGVQRRHAPAMQLLAAVPRLGVLIRCQSNAARIKPRAAVENFFSLCTPTPTSSLRPSNSRSLLPFQATRARQQLRQELRHRLHPLAQALIPHKPQPSRSPSTPAEAPPQALHRGQLISGLLNRRSLPCQSRGEPLVLPRPFPRSLTALDARGLAPRCFRPPELWPGSLGALRDHVEHARPLKGSRRTYWSDWLAPGKSHRRLGDRRSCGARRKTKLTGGTRRQWLRETGSARARRGRALGPTWAVTKRAGLVAQCAFSFSFLFKNA